MKRLELTDRESMLYNYKLNHPDATYPQIAKFFGLTPRSVGESLRIANLKIERKNNLGKSPLAPREKDALELLRGGAKDLQTIAQLLGISRNKASRYLFFCRLKGYDASLLNRKNKSSHLTL